MRGQAFETFRLAIAAIVAVTLLVIMMGILGSFGGITSDPKQTISQLLRQAQGAPGSVFSKKGIGFTEMTLSNQTFAESIGVLPSQIKFTATDDLSDVVDVSEDMMTINRPFTGNIAVASCTDGSYVIAIGIGSVSELNQQALDECG